MEKTLKDQFVHFDSYFGILMGAILSNEIRGKVLETLSHDRVEYVRLVELYTLAEKNKLGSKRSRRRILELIHNANTFYREKSVGT
jgi:hypothetical protein